LCFLLSAVSSTTISQGEVWRRPNSKTEKLCHHLRVTKTGTYWVFATSSQSACLGTWSRPLRVPSQSSSMLSPHLMLNNFCILHVDGKEPG
jgi:hypothetical protein